MWISTLWTPVVLLIPAQLACAVEIYVNWSNPLKIVRTAATVEVDVMPQLARNSGAPTPAFDGYMRALSSLGASYVRFAPWFGYPRVVVPEWERTNCSGSNWNSTLLDGVMADFMTSVCGPDAAKGDCSGGRLSVAPQLSTVPAWLFQSDGINRTHDFPASTPWRYVPGHLSHYAAHGTPLVDPSCEEMASYAARYVGWYTAGGFEDACGSWHASGLHYRWDFLSVLNEDEYHTPPGGGLQYTICYDAWTRKIRTANPNITLIGPEIADLDYALYFMNASNHADRRPPPVVTMHQWISAPDRTGSFSILFSGVDKWLATVADPLDTARPTNTVLAMNEFIPYINDWCNSTQPGRSRCGGDAWKWASSAGATPNRVTLGWNAAAACFAYAFGKLAERGWLYVGADQLIGGPYPNNEAGVASLDWTNGAANAKYYVVQMLAQRLGAGPKQVIESGSSNSSLLYSLALELEGGVRMILLVSKAASTITVDLADALGGARTASFAVVDARGTQPGWASPRTGVLNGSISSGSGDSNSSGSIDGSINGFSNHDDISSNSYNNDSNNGSTRLTLGPYGVALVSLSKQNAGEGTRLLKVTSPFLNFSAPATSFRFVSSVHVLRPNHTDKRGFHFVTNLLGHSSSDGRGNTTAWAAGISGELVGFDLSQPSTPTVTFDLQQPTVLNASRTILWLSKRLSGVRPRFLLSGAGKAGLSLFETTDNGRANLVDDLQYVFRGNTRDKNIGINGLVEVTPVGAAPTDNCTVVVGASMNGSLTSTRVCARDTQQALTDLGLYTSDRLEAAYDVDALPLDHPSTGAQRLVAVVQPRGPDVVSAYAVTDVVTGEVLRPEKWERRAALAKPSGWPHSTGCNRIRSAHHISVNIVFISCFSSALNSVFVVDLFPGGRTSGVNVSAARILHAFPFVDEQPTGMLVVGRALFVAGGRALMAFDISQPRHPTVAANCTANGACGKILLSSGQNAHSLAHWRTTIDNEAVVKQEGRQGAKHFLILTAQIDNNVGLVEVVDSNLIALMEWTE